MNLIWILFNDLLKVSLWIYPKGLNPKSVVENPMVEIFIDSYGKTKQRKFFFRILGQFLGLGGLVVIWFLPWRFQTTTRASWCGWFRELTQASLILARRILVIPIFKLVFSKLYYFFILAIPWYPLTWFSVMYLSYFDLFGFAYGRRNSQQFDPSNLVSFSFCIFDFILLFSSICPLFQLSLFSSWKFPQKILKWIANPKFLLTVFQSDISHFYSVFDSRAVPVSDSYRNACLNLISRPKEEFFKLPLVPFCQY